MGQERSLREPEKASAGEDSSSFQQLLIVKDKGCPNLATSSHLQHYSTK